MRNVAWIDHSNGTDETDGAHENHGRTLHAQTVKNTWQRFYELTAKENTDDELLEMKVLTSIAECRAAAMRRMAERMGLEAASLLEASELLHERVVQATRALEHAKDKRQE